VVQGETVVSQYFQGGPARRTSRVTGVERMWDESLAIDAAITSNMTDTNTGNHIIPQTKITHRDRGYAARSPKCVSHCPLRPGKRLMYSKSFPSATENPSLHPLMDEGPLGTSRPSERPAGAILGPGLGASTRMRIPIENRSVDSLAYIGDE